MNLTNKIASGETVDVYRDGDKAIKVFKSQDAKIKALYEALTHSRVETTGLPMPIIHEVTVFEGKWAIVMDHIEGKTLHQIMKEDPANLPAYVEKMVDLQLEIHSKTMPLLSKLKDKLVRQINSLECIDDTKRYELLTRLDSMPKHKKLCHGNFTPMNIIIDGEKTYIVDWVAARQGNASADVARTYLMLCLDFPEAAELYLDTFCKKSGTAKQYVQAWLPIVAAAQLDVGKEEEKELLSRWIDVVEYE
ncbi:MAG TPA: aminoglycoside phosphotransferase family protein [Oscillospiraceae bacterium]|nr:aminoglycoside phosphotransferase family protein [Oscillospiraceae bacterium]